MESQFKVSSQLTVNFNARAFRFVWISIREVFHLTMIRLGICRNRLRDHEISLVSGYIRRTFYKIIIFVPSVRDWFVPRRQTAQFCFLSNFDPNVFGMNDNLCRFYIKYIKYKAKLVEYSWVSFDVINFSGGQL